MGGLFSMEQGASAPGLPGLNGNGVEAAEQGTATNVKKPNGASSPTLNSGNAFAANAEAPNTPKNNKNKNKNKNAAVNVNALQQVNVNQSGTNMTKPKNGNAAGSAAPNTAVAMNGQAGGRRRKSRKTRKSRKGKGNRK
jgi:hypothetical protein